MELGIQKFQLKIPNKDILQNLRCYYVWEQMSSVYPAMSVENKFNIVKYWRGKKEENFSAFWANMYHITKSVWTGRIQINSSLTLKFWVWSAGCRSENQNVEKLLKLHARVDFVEFFLDVFGGGSAEILHSYYQQHIIKAQRQIDRCLCNLFLGKHGCFFFSNTNPKTRESQGDLGKECLCLCCLVCGRTRNGWCSPSPRAACHSSYFCSFSFSFNRQKEGVLSR